jgi:NhaA family Na+:H+ antiporter
MVSGDSLPAARQPTRIDLLTSPFMRFARMEASGGILLLAATLIALVWANSPWEHSYHTVWDADISLGIGRNVLTWSRHVWVNDGLMSIFFFAVGLEIKREVLIGELTSFRRIVFPLVAALGGCVLPAVIYLVINHGTPEASAWGIPMATDIAFALGVLTLVGNHVPVSLKLFVAALAIVDDIFAVLVIAFFYTEHLQLIHLLFGAAGVALAYAANKMGVRNPWIYAFIGIPVWFAVRQSGVHATIAGVMMAFTIPCKSEINQPYFMARMNRLLHRFANAEPASNEAHATIRSMEKLCEGVETPLSRIEHTLQPWVSFVIMPLFALSNAGVPVLGNILSAVTNRVAIGVALGLLLGKPFGITLFAWAAEKIGLATRPRGTRWMQVFAASWVCGIGFTMSLFIAALALPEGHLLDLAKIGTLSASVVAGLAGYLFFRRTGPAIS